VRYTPLLLALVTFSSPCSHAQPPAPPADVPQANGPQTNVPQTRAPQISSARTDATNCPSPMPAQQETIDGAVGYVYKTAGRDLRLHVFMPGDQKRASPAILFFFGGGWRTGTITAFEDQAKVFASRGYVAALADYRVLCRDHTTPFDAVDDAHAAYEWLRANAETLRIDSKQIALAGGSAGGHLALAVGMRTPADRKPLALVLFNPAIDMMPLAAKLDIPAAAVREISPSTLSTRNLPPTIAFHGTADGRVAIETVRAFCSRAKKDGRVCELHEYIGHRHSFFHGRTVDPRISATPFDDTMTKALAFVARFAG
jgi:acetyl esterase